MSQTIWTSFQKPTSPLMAACELHHAAARAPRLSLLFNSSNIWNILTYIAKRLKLLCSQYQSSSWPASSRPAMTSPKSLHLVQCAKISMRPGWQIHGQSSGAWLNPRFAHLTMLWWQSIYTSSINTNFQAKKSRCEQQLSFSKPNKRGLSRQWLQWNRWAEIPSSPNLPNSEKSSTCST